MRETPFGSPGDRDMGETGCDGRPARPSRPGVLGSVTLPRSAAEVATARRFVARTLGDRPQTATAVLLASEAVTNAVVHTDGPDVTLLLVETPGGVRVEVTDHGAKTVPTLYDGCDLREDGRGVLLLRLLSARCGFHADERGLTVWFEL